MTTPENIDSVDDIILGDRRIGFKLIAEALHFSYERVFHDLGMTKLSSKWITNDDQKRYRVTTSSEICRRFEEDFSNFLEWLVTMDETLVHH